MFLKIMRDIKLKVKHEGESGSGKTSSSSGIDNEGVARGTIPEEINVFPPDEAKNSGSIFVVELL